MKLDLTKTEAQAVAAACQIAAHEWAKGVGHCQKWARMVNDIGARIVMSVLSEEHSHETRNS